MMGHYSSHCNDGAPSLVSVGGIVSHHWYCGRNRAPSLVSEQGIAPHHWCQSKE
ncbi:unnamed protein product [Staurois parvus]|uniref:Uncharacterized protein n=1 Tax=Staurois parvus TaxID=386267 RepID=A0ABN9CBP4_9NEOB|nr:unnamed protein product [Staurois parvus]